MIQSAASLSLLMSICGFAVSADVYIFN